MDRHNEKKIHKFSLKYPHASRRDLEQYTNQFFLSALALCICIFNARGNEVGLGGFCGARGEEDEEMDFPLSIASRCRLVSHVPHLTLE